MGNSCDVDKLRQPFFITKRPHGSLQIATAILKEAGMIHYFTII